MTLRFAASDTRHNLNQVIDKEVFFSTRRDLGGLDYRPYRSPFHRVVKRGFDIVGSLLIIAIFLPLFLTVAVAIFCRDRGSIVFSHKRVGLNGKEFGCLKFRTMVSGAEEKLQDVLRSCPEKQLEWSTTQKLTADPRVISGVGEFLRKSSLDELPQLFNILSGQMSFIGPRPVTESELCHYGSMVKYYLATKPGLTGPWQIGGRSDLSFDERVRLDIDYAMNGTLVTDCRIFAKTISAFLSGRLGGAA